MNLFTSKLLKLLSVFFILFTLAACGGGGGGGGGDEAIPVSVALPNTSNSATLTGESSLTWQVNEAASYDVEVSLSSDSGVTYEVLHLSNTRDSGTYILDTRTFDDLDSYRLKMVVKNSSGDVVASSASKGDFSISNTLTQVEVLSPTSMSAQLLGDITIVGRCESDFDVDVLFDTNSSGETTSPCLPNGTFSHPINFLITNNLSTTTLVFSQQIGNKTSSQEYVIRELKPVTLTLPTISGGNDISGNLGFLWAVNKPGMYQIDMSVSSDSGATYGVLSTSSETSNGSYILDTRLLDNLSSYRLKMTATDENAQVVSTSESDVDFTVANTLTSLSITSPGDMSYMLSSSTTLTGACENGFDVSIQYDSNSSGDSVISCSTSNSYSTVVSFLSIDEVATTNISVAQPIGNRSPSIDLTLKTRGEGGWTPLSSTLTIDPNVIWTGDTLLTWGGRDGTAQTLDTGEIIDPTVGGKGATLSAINAPAQQFCRWTDTSQGAERFLILICSQPSYNRRYDLATDTWTNIATAQYRISSRPTVYNLGKYIVVVDGLNQLWLYDVTTDTWEAASTANGPGTDNCCGAQAHNDRYLFMWGSKKTSSPYNYSQNGYMFDVQTKSWEVLPIDASTPSPRAAAMAVWDGTSFIVWGGATGPSLDKTDGAKYNPATRVWTGISDTNGLADSRNTSALIVGNEMFVLTRSNIKIYNSVSDTWSDGGALHDELLYRISYGLTASDTKIYALGGQVYDSSNPNSMMTGRLFTYDVATRLWTSDGVIEPPVVRSHGGSTGGSASLIWDDVNNKAILWSAGMGHYQGGLFDPQTLTWAPLNMTNAPTLGGYHTSGVWTGSKMLVWAHQNANGRGFSYDPGLDSWSSWSSVGAHMSPDPMFAWLGSSAFAWSNSSVYVLPSSTGALYDPLSDAWQTISTTNTPEPKYSTLTSAVPIGSEKAIIWSGSFYDSSASPYMFTSSTGHIFDGATNSWQVMSTVNAPEPRDQYGAVWTGSKYIVWGGRTGGGATDTGGIYDPQTDTWLSLSTVNAPPAATYPLGVWTGTHALFWSDSGGGLYEPVSGTWSAMRINNSPEGIRTRTLGVWMGDALLIYGGSNSDMNTGGVWRP